MTELLVASPLVRAIGVALIEFTWQGGVIGAVGAFALLGLRRAGAEARYVVACLTLATMAAAPVITVTDRVSDPAFRNLDMVARSTAASGAAESGAGSDAMLRAPWQSGPEAVTQAGPVSAVVTGRWLPAVVLLWSVGVLVLTALLLRGWLRLARLRRSAVDLATGPWPDVLASLATRCGVRRQVRLIESAQAAVPFIVGWLRPVVVVPTSALAGLSPAHLEAILIHELMHIRRGDYLVNAVQCGVEILLFYHPAVWWTSRQIRIEREHCCDDLAVAASSDRRSYAQALLSLETLRRRPTLAMAADGGDLLVRIRRLMSPGSASTPALSGGLVMSMVLTVLLLAVGGPLSGMQQGAEPGVDHGAIGAQVAPSSTTAPMTPIATTTRTDPKVAATTATPAATTALSAGPAARAAVPIAATATTSRPAGTTLDPVPTSSAAGALDLDASVQTHTAQAPAAQTRVTLRGTVVDAQGGAVPGATVTLSRELGGNRRMLTTAPGRFVMSDLLPGTYQLTVSYEGFRDFRASTVEVRADTEVRVQLRLGSVSEAVHVRPGGSPLAPTTGISTSPRSANDDSGTLPLAHSEMGDAVTVVAAEHSEWPGPQQNGASAPRPVRIGGAVKPPRKIADVAPQFPAEAVGMVGARGLVQIEATIGQDGSVRDARLLRNAVTFDATGIAALRERGSSATSLEPVTEALGAAALAAVSQWRYSPALLNGKPTDVAMTATISFVP